MTSLAHKSSAAAVGEKMETVLAKVDELEKQNVKLREEVVALKEKGVAQYPPGFDPRIPFAQIGRSASVNDGYSILRMAGFCRGIKPREEAKYELDIAEKLKAIYASKNFVPAYVNSFLVPNKVEYIPYANSAEERTVTELREKAVADAKTVIDLDEVQHIADRTMPGWRQKDIGTLSDTGVGVLVGFPTLMQLVDIQRNVEVFAQAGATETGLPANGRMQYPKLTNTTTANWIGEGTLIPESNPTTGSLDLIAKKLGVFVDFNNELLRFNTISAEAMTRMDMAKVAALKIDLAMLEGTGGNQIKGLITYDSASSWTTGQDKLLTFTVTSNVIQINDAADMEALLPDTAGEPTAWVMRRNLWSKIRNRRFGASTATDSGGGYLVNFTREFGDPRPLRWDSTPVIRSSQVSNTRGNGSQTYVILGYFPDWVIGRFGALEFLASNTSDQAMTNDQTRLRCIQHIDAGARHASSFVFADAITIS